MNEQYDPTIENNLPSATASHTDEPTTPQTVVAARPLTRRYNKRGHRRGKYAYAAPLGFFISLLSVIGVIAIILSGVGAIRKATDTTQLGEDLYYFLEPLLMYSPTPFEDAAANEQDAFLNAATYQVMQTEQIRMLQEKDETCAYPVDDSGRIAVPVEEVLEAYKFLFGPEATPTHRSIEESSLTYSEADNCYYIPFETLTNSSRPVIDYVDRNLRSCVIRIGFVPIADIGLDDHGNEVAPTAEMATHFQTYTLLLADGAYYVYACTDE